MTDRPPFGGGGHRRVAASPCVLVEGASFEGTRLVESEPNAAEFSSAPELHVAFVNKAEHKDAGGATMPVPIYITPSREKLLMEIQLPCRDEPATWILAGVALFLSTE